MFLLAWFGAGALLLATLGVFGVMAYSVSQRTHELGVRLALGAERRAVARMILVEALRVAVVGLTLGVAAALAVTRFLRALLFEVTPTDPATFAGVIVVLLGAALVATYVPAFRAMRVDPVVALRYE